MRMAAFLFCNALLIAGWWRLLGARTSLSPGERLAYAGFLAAIQGVVTALLLGIAGLLRLPYLLAALGAVTALLFVLPGRGGAAPAPAPAPAPASWRTSLSPANVVLGLGALGFIAWALLATWLLPPRGIDDLAYHLPTLYQAVQEGRIGLLPLELRPQFAMPLAGDLLFLWPLVFFHADTWVDGVQLGVALHAALVLGLLARRFGVTARDALFIGLLFLLTPVVMLQAAASYNDLILAACHLLLLHALVAFWRDGGRVHLVVAALAAGAGLATKYSMLIAIAAAQPLLVGALWRHGRAAALVRGYAIFLPLLALLPAYWLVRNAVVLGEPFYPYALGLGGLRDLGLTTWQSMVTANTEVAGRALGKLFGEPLRLLTFLWRDPGLGSLNGGLGLVFWGLGLPALGWCLARAGRAWWVARDPLPLFFWLTAPAVLGLYLAQVDAARLQFNMRLVLVLVPLGLLALALLLARLREVLPVAVVPLRLVCVGAAGLALLVPAAATLPAMDVRPALADRRDDRWTTSQHYYRQAYKELARLAPVFEPLDHLTLEGPGWDVYMAAEWNLFTTAPLYGSRLQNRVWNFLPLTGRRPPDALLYYGVQSRLYYPGGAVWPDATVEDPRYTLLARQGAAQLWVARERLAAPAVQARLAGFCARRHAAEIEAAATVLGALPPAELLLGSPGLVHGFRCLAVTGRFAVPVELVIPGREADVARRSGARRVLSVGVPVAGMSSRPLASVRTREGTLTLHYNEVAS